MQIATVGLDLAKTAFQVHGVDVNGKVVASKMLRRPQVGEFFAALPPALIGMEACASSNYWARQFEAMGHTVRIMPSAYVKPYVKREKNDKSDAAAICEAVTRPTMRFVPIKTIDQQVVLMMHRTRRLLTHQMTMIRNSLRSHLAELGFITEQGNKPLRTLVVEAFETKEFPLIAKATLVPLTQLWSQLELKIKKIDKMLLAWHKKSKASQLLTTIPGIGYVAASAIIATVGDLHRFESGRQFAAWIGLVPRQYSSGGKPKLGTISRRGDRYLRSLLFMGAIAQLSLRHRKRNELSPWIESLLSRRPGRVVCIAVANKLARIIWAVSTRNEPFHLSPARA